MSSGCESRVIENSYINPGIAVKFSELSWGRKSSQSIDGNTIYNYGVDAGSYYYLLDDYLFRNGEIGKMAWFVNVGIGYLGNSSGNPILKVDLNVHISHLINNYLWNSYFISTITFTEI